MNTNRFASPRALILALSAAGVLGAVGAGAYTSASALGNATPPAVVAASAPQITLPDFSTITQRDGAAVVNISVSGVTKTSDTVFTVEKKNFAPDRDLEILIVTAEPAFKE